MRYLALALAIMAFASCGTHSSQPRDGGYDLKVTNNHPDDVVVYLYNGSRRRIGRILGPSGKETWHLSTSEVRMGSQILVCVGNYRPGAPCYMTPRMTGGYAGEWGQPGTVLLVIQRGVGGIVAMLNG